MKRSVMWFVIKRWWFWWFGVGDKAVQFGEELPVNIEDLRDPKKREQLISNLKQRVTSQIAGFAKKMKAEPLIVQGFRRRTAKEWTITWTCAFNQHTRKSHKIYMDRLIGRNAARMVQAKDWGAMIWKRDLTQAEPEAAQENGASTPATSDSDAPTGASTAMPDTTRPDLN
jgi:hypothetical protein